MFNFLGFNLGIHCLFHIVWTSKFHLLVEASALLHFVKQVNNLYFLVYFAELFKFLLEGFVVDLEFNIGLVFVLVQFLVLIKFLVFVDDLLLLGNSARAFLSSPGWTRSPWWGGTSSLFRLFRLVAF